MKFEQFEGFEMPHKKEGESLRDTTKKGVEKEGFLQGLAEKKKAIMAVAAFGVVTAGANEVLAGSKADELFDDLDSITETTKKAPSVHQDRVIQGESKKKQHIDAFKVLERVEEFVGAYKDAKTDSERDRYATEIAETLIMGGKYQRLEENTIHTFTATFFSAPVEVRYIVMDGTVHGSLTDTNGMILRKVHEFRFSVK